jgi:hypothetical protein
MMCSAATSGSGEQRGRADGVGTADSGRNGRVEEADTV